MSPKTLKAHMHTAPKTLKHTLKLNIVLERALDSVVCGPEARTYEP